MTSIARLASGCESQSFDPTVEKTVDGEGVYDSYHGDYCFDKNDAQVDPSQ
jgi:hypothetical protein